MRKKLLLFIAIILVLSLVFIAAKKEGVEEKGRPLVGFPMTGLDDEFWIKYLNFAKQAAAYYGIDTVVLDSQYNESKQLANLEDLIARGCDGIILTPLSGELGPRLIEICNNNEVPVVITDTYPNLESGAVPMYLGFIGLDDEVAGYNTAKVLFDRGAKNIVAIDGIPGISTSEGRHRGMVKAVEEAGGQLLDSQPSYWTREKGMKIMEDFLQAYGDKIDGVWSAGTDPLLGALTAIENAGKKGDILLAGIDHTTSGLDALKDGNITVLGGGHWAMSGWAMTILNDYFNGVKVTPEKYYLELIYLFPEDVPTFMEKIAYPLAAGVPIVDWSKVNKKENPDVDYRKVFKTIKPEDSIVK